MGLEMDRRRLENESDRRKLQRLAQRLRTVSLELDRFVFNQFPEPLPTGSAGTALTDLFVSGWNSERARVRRCSDPNLREFLNHQSDYSVRLRTQHVHLRPDRDRRRHTPALQVAPADSAALMGRGFGSQ
jgi:hypothetical protein